MPVLKSELLDLFYQRSVTTEQAFAVRCQVSRQTLRNASNGLTITNKVAEAIACGMGFLPQEMCLLCDDNDTHSVAQLVEMSVQRLGLGLWGVCDHNFAQTERLFALLQHWRGEQIQRLRGQSGEERELVSTLEGRLRAAGRTVGGDFTLRINEPNFFDANIGLRVEGYWLGDNHFIAIYRFNDSYMPNYGTVHLTLSLCKSRLDGTFVGWGNPESAWVNGEIHLRRVAPTTDARS